MLNNVVLIGRLTRDPEVRTTTSGSTVARFTLAVERDFAGRDGNKETDFIPIIAWRGLGELVGKYLSKGKMCAVQGQLHIRNYEDKDGNKRTIAEINANNIQFLTPKNKEQSNGSSGSYDDLTEVAPLDEDIPF